MKKVTDNGFVNFVLDALMAFGQVEVRKMFGGYGLYEGSVIFGIIVSDTLYLKADETTQADFKRLRSKPFAYETKRGKTATMPYWEVPLEILEDSEKLAKWAAKAHSISLASKKKL